ncbi:sensor histidine kinase [Lachnotalea glycerini]|uniref:sensor histidine kinase n=1 Tax=Lachnotalea glycerini TaxID=1763509 RepID=UPI001FA92CFA|nr:HAMP domain-containing sensor histidine kinase [Lachnotalea glycerini]
MAENKNIEVTVDCNEEIFVCHDEKWTTEALFNILDNAVKYTPSEGKIHISVQQLEMYTKIDISDNGRGIKENHHATIFKRFYREESDEDGLGIGLYLAREIISLQGGYIKVTSKLGKGATFSVYLLNK